MAHGDPWLLPTRPLSVPERDWARSLQTAQLVAYIARRTGEPRFETSAEFHDVVAEPNRRVPAPARLL